MKTIKETIEMAKKGDKEDKRIIKNHYSYLVDEYYKKYKNKTSRKEVRCIFDSIIEEYYTTETNIHLVLYLHKYLSLILHEKYDEKQIEVRNTVLLACQGDMKARNALINHYSKIVTELAKEYDYLEYEELVQFGMIKLIEHIDKLIKEHNNGEFHINCISRTIELYFKNTLRKKVEKWNRPLGYIDDQLENKKFELEFESVIDGYTTNAERRYILKEYFFEKRTLEDIGKEVGQSKESVRKIVKIWQPQLKRTYLK